MTTMIMTMIIKNKLLALTLGALFILFPCTMKAQHFIGLREGVRISSVSFNPSQRDSSSTQWLNVGLVYRYYNYSWVGFQTGLNYADKGFRLNDTTHRYRILELPLLSQFHYETWHLRFLVNLGVYGSYALSGEMSYEQNGEEQKSGYIFTDRDRRFEYGIHVGGGIGFVFKPVELMFEAGYQYAFSYMIDPKYKGQRTMFTHFNHLMFSVALLVQL